MITADVRLENPERFDTAPPLTKAKLEEAAKAAICKLEENLPRFTSNFNTTQTFNFKYKEAPNNNWTNGMHTGLYWLAYELTGSKKFFDAARIHVKSFEERLENRVGLDNHDVGFCYTPSCVADYRITGSAEARELALASAEILYNNFSREGGFIIRYGDGSSYPGYRTIIDSMMNIPLFLWAAEETGDKKYIEAAVLHYHTTSKYLIREDASTFHHYQFDPETHKPVEGVTFQGYANDSCWARGQSWAVYGFPIAYSYTKDKELIDIHKNVSYYFLNKLPSDCIPYWDLVFTEGSDQPRDSSAAAISVCGLLEMCRHLPGSAPEKKIFQNAAAHMMNAMIDTCSIKNKPESDGILLHVTHALPQGFGIDECATYGDYFYLEALIRFLKPDWNMYW